MTRPRRCVVLVNRVDDPLLGDATVAMAHAAAKLDVPTYLCAVDGVSLSPGDRVCLRGIRVTGELTVAQLRSGRGVPPLVSLGHGVEGLVGPGAEGAALGRRAPALAPGDLVLVRTNPARDVARAPLHRHVALVASLLERQGVAVVNSAATLSLGWSKAFLSWLPADLRPVSLVTTDRSTLLAWVAAQPGGVVVKPVAGTHGSGVFLVSEGDRPNLQQICDAVLRDGPAIAQRWVPGAEQGDVRVLLLDGEPVRLAGRDAAVQRVPASGAFRSNIHAGGEAVSVTLTDRQRQVVRQAGAALLEHGVRVAGVDLIGEHIVEVNVHAPGGLGDMSRFTGVDVTAHVVATLLGAPAG